MAYTDRASFAEIISAAHTSIGAAYAKIGSPLADSAIVLMFTNKTDGECFISTNGTTNHLIVPANGYLTFDIRTNAPNMTNLLFASGTQFWIKDGPTAPTTGTFYIQILQVTR